MLALLGTAHPCGMLLIRSDLGRDCGEILDICLFVKRTVPGSSNDQFTKKLFTNDIII